MSYFIVAAVLTATMYGADPTIAHKVDVKDRNGVSVLTISDIKMSRRSALVLQGVVRNVSGADLTVDTVVGTVHKKDGSTVEFLLASVTFSGAKSPKIPCVHSSTHFPSRGRLQQRTWFL